MRNEPGDEPAATANKPDSPQRALLLDTDLFFAVKITDTLKHVGYLTRTVRQFDAFTEALVADRPAIALVNTAAHGVDWQGAIHAARAANVPAIAFGSHVDIETQERARRAGATSVIPNSRVASDLPGVVARALRRNIPGHTADTTSDEASADCAPSDSDEA